MADGRREYGRRDGARVQRVQFEPGLRPRPLGRSGNEHPGGSSTTSTIGGRRRPGIRRPGWRGVSTQTTPGGPSRSRSVTWSLLKEGPRRRHIPTQSARRTPGCSGSSARPTCRSRSSGPGTRARPFRRPAIACGLVGAAHQAHSSSPGS